MSPTLTSSNILPITWENYAACTAFADLEKDVESYHIAVISDIHLGHRHIPAKKMIADLERQFPDSRMRALTVVVISGDLFDHRLAHDSEEAYLIGLWMERFTRQAKRCNTIIIILEGTPSHDCKQSMWMVTYNEIAQIGADVRYYPELAIDELFPGGPTILFVPDEVNHDASRTWKQVTAMMRDRGLDKVDFAVMHGFFHYQAPATTLSSHDEECYEGIVRYRIVIGHHHTHTTFGIIVVPGSTDRHKHGQEEAKGHYQFSFNPTRGVFDEKFIINENAVIFTSINVAGKELREVEAILRELEASPDGSNYRLLLSSNDESYNSFSKLKVKFPHFKLSYLNVDVKRPISDLNTIIERPVITSIRNDTIESMLLDRIAKKRPDVRPEVLAFIGTVILE